MSTDKLPKVYTTRRNAAEFDPELYVSTYISPDLDKPYSLTTEQLRFMKAMLSGKYEEGWFAGGNSSGKTWTAKFIGTMFADYKLRPTQPRAKSYEEWESTPYNILCTGPENKQAMELWQEIEKAFKESPILSHLVLSTTTGSRRNIHPVMELANNVRIEAIGLHDKGKHVEGQTYDLELCNEPADVRHLIHCYERVLVPRMFRRGGLLMGFGTPKGKNEYYNLWRRGKDLLDGTPNKWYEPLVYSQYSDSRTNQFVNQKAIKSSMDGKSTDWVRERIEGRFTDSVFSAFKDTDIDRCLDMGLGNNIACSTTHNIVHGLDFGRKGDFTGCISWDTSVRPHKQLNVLRVGGGMVSWENIFEDIINIYRKYGGEFIIDSTGMAGDMQSEWMADLGIPYIPFSFGGSPSKKVALINNLQDYVAKAKFRMGPHDQLLAELRSYPADLQDKGIATDMVMALALVAWGARNYEPLGPVEPITK